MDNCTHQSMPMPNPQPAPPAPAPVPTLPAGAPQEATGDSESDAPVSAPTVRDRRPSVATAYAEDDAESYSGDGGGENNCVSIVDDDVRGADDVAMEVEGDENEVDSRLSVPCWRRTAQDAAGGASGGGCSWPQVAAAVESVAAGVAGASHAAESKLFWEACIAHGY